jgi:fatty-acyl-CoA synthase
MLSTMMNYPLTIVQLLERAGRYYSSIEIVSRLPGQSTLHRTTYGEFYRRSRALAQALTRAGLKRGERVATLMWNHHIHLEAYFGVPAAGGVIHALNLRLHPDDLVYIIGHAEDRFLIVDDALLPLLGQLRDRVKLERVFVARHGGGPLPTGCEDYEELLAGASGDFVYPELDENEACGMCYTSGTTGRPRGVVYSHRSNVLHSYNAGLATSLGLKPGDCVCAVVPLFHANGWGLPYSTVLMGARLVLPGPRLDAESVLELLQGERVLVSAGVPTVWLAVLQALDREPGRWHLMPGLRLFVGGSAAPESLIRGFDRHGIAVVHAWGMTETSPMASTGVLKPNLQALPEDQRYAYRAKQGYPFPFVDLRVMAEGQEVPPDGQTMGELQARGPYVTASYYRQPDDGEKFTADGWLRTGDVATVDAEGYIKITDRTKDLIKSGGEWISSVDLENAIMGHPAVAEAAVIAVPHPKWDERPLAAIVVRPGASVSAEEIRALLEKRFAKWWLPDEIVFVAEIPKNSTGKFLKSKLREQFQERFALPTEAKAS